MIIQPDLFGEDDAAELARQRDALTCLIEAHPRTLQLLIGDRTPDRGETRASASGDWAYRVRTDALYFEDRDSWSRRGGWDQRPAHSVTWDELDALLAGDPRVDDLRAWSESLAVLDAWRVRQRPCELWPHPEGWHPSYIATDHARPEWPERIHAWEQTIAVLTDARDGL